MRTCIRVIKSAAEFNRTFCSVACDGGDAEGLSLLVGRYRLDAVCQVWPRKDGDPLPEVKLDAADAADAAELAEMLQFFSE
jgi:hypothetical protein